MKKNYLAALTAMGLLSLNSLAQITQTFSYSGSTDTFTVPSCVSQMSIDMRGAQGANAIDKLTTNSTGGLGGRVTGVLTVTPGQVFYINVGEQGGTTGGGAFNGGGHGGLSTAGGGCNGGYAGGGGGATDMRLGGTALSNRIIVAGGGGGSGRDYCNGTCVPCGCGGSGGAGGGLTGNNGQAANNCGFSYPGGGTNFGSGGTASAGGALGPGDSGGPNGTAGVLGAGGDGGTGSYDVSGGGGGGGYYGGGGGGSASSGSGVGGGGGGGGSSFLGTLTSAVTTPSFQSGHGLLIITYVVNGGIVNAAASSTLICSGTSINLTTSGTVNSYTWNTGSNSSSLTVSPTTNTVYSVSATNSIGCISNASLSIVVNSGLPVLSVATSTNQTCLGKTVTLTATGANTYTWNNGVVNGISYTPSVTSTYIVSGQNACGTSTASTTVTVAPLPVSITAPSTSICAGSAINLTVTAAATNYTWSPVAFSGTVLGVSPNSNTTYSVAASDGTCAGNATFALNVIANPTVSATISSTQVCAGTPVSLSAQGSPGVTFNWTPGNITTANATVVPTVPTAYSVGVTAPSGCSSGTSVVVITLPSPTVSLVSSAAMSCPGDPVNLSASGATSYLWNNGSTTSSIVVSPTVSTSYTVTGTASGCSTDATVLLTVFAPTVSISGPTAVCNGQAVSLQASAADTYTWLPSGSNFSGLTDTPLATTIYTLVTLTASGSINCPTTNTVQVIVNPNPTVTAVASRTAICKNEQVVLTASGANTYSWSNSATTASISVTSTLITNLNYVVTGFSSSGCANTTTVTVKVNGCNAINELNGLAAALQIYPNPSNGDFTIQYPSEIKLTLVNELGQLIKVINISSANDYKVHVSGLSNGIYFIKGTKDNQNFERKIIVNK